MNTEAPSIRWTGGQDGTLELLDQTRLPSECVVLRIQDLEGVREWLADRDRPLVLDAKVDPDICAEWLEEAFRGH